MKYIHYVWFVTTATGNEDFFIDWESNQEIPKFEDMVDKITESLTNRGVTLNCKFGVKNVTTVKK